MRKTKPKKRILLPDPRYNDPYVTRFVNNLMLNGKKSKAYEIFYGAMDIIEARTKDEGKSALEIFKTALENITPQVEDCLRESRIKEGLVLVNTKHI